VLGLAQCGDLHKAGNAATARHVGLQHLDRGQREQAAKIVEVVAILAGSDIQPGGGTRPHQRQPGNIIGADRLLEPSDVVFGKVLGQGQGLFRREGAVGIDEQAGVTNRVARRSDTFGVARRLAADFHFYPTAAIAFCPTGQLAASTTLARSSK